MVLFRDMCKRWLEIILELVGEFGGLDNPVLQRATGDPPSHSSSSAPADNLAERFTADWAAMCKKDEEFWATVGPFAFLKDGEANEVRSPGCRTGIIANVFLQQCEGFITEMQAKTLLRFKEENLEERLAGFRQSIRPRFKAMG